jgi:hypothetical protein
MKPSLIIRLLIASFPLMLVSALAQGPKGAASLTSDQIIERASSSVALAFKNGRGKLPSPSPAEPRLVVATPKGPKT